MSLPRLSSLLVACALVLSGCGENGDQRAARATIDHFYAALRAHDANAACGVLSPSVRREMARAFNTPRKPCVSALEGGFRRFAATNPKLFDTAPEVRSVLVKGDEAIATVQRAYQRRKIGLKKVDGRWQITAAPNFGG